jgi:Fe2+ or Zn2+ uptake regulation protein
MASSSQKTSSDLPLPADTARRVRSALEQAGCRYTRQRAAVYSYLEQVQSHPTAEEVYKAVRDWLPRISLATVYNALEALVQARLANKLTYGDGSARYDCRDEQHYHLRDEVTGEIRDLPTQFDVHLLQKLDPSLVERLSGIGFQVTGYRLEVLGRFERRGTKSS